MNRASVSCFALAAASAIACGGRPAQATLGKPGTDQDDGAGQLATASTQILVGGSDDDGAGFGSDHRTTSDQSQYGAYGYGGGYGGGGYGGGAYGGYLYGGYVPYGAAVNPTAAVPNPYSGIGVTDGGSITGTVRWPRPPSAPAVLAMAGCGDVANPTLAIGHGATVADTVVYLARVDRGRAVPVAGRTLQVGGAVERRGCTLEPSVQVATPVPSTLTVINSETAHVDVAVGVGGGSGGSGGSGGKDAMLSLDEGMSRTTPLGTGPVRVADVAGALIPAWVVGVPHPYYTLTDGEGRFRIDDVPAGMYELVVWHAPVVVGVKDGKVVVTAAVEVRRNVVVKALAAVVVGVDLPVVR